MNPKVFFITLVSLTVAIIILSGAGYFLGSKRLEVRTAELQATMVDLAASEDNIAELTALRGRLNKIQPSLPAIEAALPKTKRQSELLLQLQTLAANRGMSIPSVSVGAAGAGAKEPLPSALSQTAKVGDSLVMPMTLQLSGSYDQLSGFLKDLERLNRYVNVNSLSISKADKGRTLSFQIGLNAYVKP